MKRGKKIEEKRLLILEVAEQLIVEKGFKKTSVRDICAKANINVAMISYYFGSKDKMMLALFEYRIQNMRENFSLFYQTIAQASPEMQIKEIINFIIQRIAAFNHFIGFIMNESQFMDLNTKSLKDFYFLFAEKLEETIQRGISTGQFKRAVKGENLVATILGTVIFTVKNKDFFMNYINQKEDSLYYKQLEIRLKSHLSSTVFSLLEYEQNEN